jgi:hypothetical protein
MARKASIVIAAAIALIGISVWAQRPLGPPAPEAPRPALGHEIAGQVFSGDDLGVRVTGKVDQDGKVPGTLVVKINGQWIEVAAPTGR